MRISDWSSDVCSSDLITWSSFRPAESERRRRPLLRKRTSPAQAKKRLDPLRRYCNLVLPVRAGRCGPLQARSGGSATMQRREVQRRKMQRQKIHLRSEEHTSELQSLMHISYAVFCLKKNNKTHKYHKKPILTNTRQDIHSTQHPTN